MNEHYVLQKWFSLKHFKYYLAATSAWVCFVSHEDDLTLSFC